LYNKELKLPLVVVCDNLRDPGNMGTLIRSCAAFGVEKIILTKGCVDAWEPKVVRSGCGAHFRLPIIDNIEWSQINECLLDDRPLDILLAESNTVNTDQIKSSNNNFNENIDLKTYMTQTPLLSLMFNEVNFFANGLNRKSVIIIGSEAYGLSNDAYKLAQEYNGRRIKIPLSFGVDSLNSAIAATIILFEMKRQFIIQFSEHSHENSVSII
jgi:16S rRNA (guanosine(1370)-2'-O)-methyltransferase